MVYTEKMKEFNEFVESRLTEIKNEYINQFLDSVNHKELHISLDIVVHNKPLIRYIK